MKRPKTGENCKKNLTKKMDIRSYYDLTALKSTLKVFSYLLELTKEY